MPAPARSTAPRVTARHSWVKKVAGAGSCNFPTDSWKFPTEEIMGAHNFYSALIFPKMGVLAPKFAFLKKNFPTGENVSDNFPTAQNLGAGAIALLPPLPRRHGCSLK